MPYGDDITEGIPYVLSNPVGAISYSANAESYDIAINEMPFFLNTGDEFPYSRQTSQYRKQQIDQSNEPGEQSITGWWVRAQSSFHNGSGVKFYDPSVGESVSYRFADSRGVDVWEKGKVTLLKDTANMSGVTSGIYKLISAVDGSTDKVVAWTPANTTIKNYTASGTAVTYTDVTSIAQPLDTAILAVATDGTSLFIADNDHIYTGPISTPTAGYSRYYNTGSEKVVLGWVKQRLVACVGAGVYELTNAKGSTHTLPTAAYTHPNASWTWTSISEGGSAIYAAGYAGTTSAIYKFTLASNGSMPVLTSGVIAAQLPIGEYVNKIESYLGYLVIGTNKGIRVANISDTTGDLTYGPLIIEAENTGYDFAFRDKFIWVTGSVGGYAGLYRMDLSNELEDLRFAYATDAYLDGVAGYATSVDFIGNSNQIAFTTSGDNGIAVQSTTTLIPSGYVTTGKIRYGTLENKVFKILKPRIDNTNGGLSIKSIDAADIEYGIGTFAQGDFTPEISVNYPVGAQEYVSFKFEISRSSTNSANGPIFSGYQLKSLPAVSRQRLITYPLACYDREKDAFGNQVGHEGAAYEKLALLETVEGVGDTIRVEDFRTGESYLGIIEQLQFINRTPSDKRFSGFGGILVATIRTI
jgi:hypothetical protein